MYKVLFYFLPFIFILSSCCPKIKESTFNVDHLDGNKMYVAAIYSKGKTKLSYPRNVDIENDLKDRGIRLINRDECYWSVKGSINDLKALSSNDYVLTNHHDDIHSRHAQILVPNGKEISSLAQYKIEIHGHEEVPAGKLVHCEGHDYQFDLIQEDGYEIKEVTRNSRFAQIFNGLFNR